MGDGWVGRAYYLTRFIRPPADPKRDAPNCQSLVSGDVMLIAESSQLIFPRCSRLSGPPLTSSQPDTPALINMTRGDMDMSDYELGYIRQAGGVIEPLRLWHE